ncbi:MAG TPA: SNF2-related protein [Candidatus Krumholzibacteria bacterium]|nr:SNF2-related protein [Candidatus Krumholzibacteria bacterium]
MEESDGSRAVLTWTEAPEGLLFSCTSANTPLAPEEWGRFALYDSSGSRCSAGPILRLLDEDDASQLVRQDHDGGVLVGHQAVSSFAPGELLQLGLPMQCPFTLELSASQRLTAPNSHIDYRYWHPDGFPIGSLERRGSLVTSSEDTFVLSEPVHLLVSGIDEFNAHPPESMPERLAAWGRLKELVPQDARLDDHLKSTRVAVASTFTLQPFLNDQGEADFSPVPGWTQAADLEAGEDEQFEEILPEARQEEFERRFVQFRSARTEYPVGTGWFLVWSPDTLRALEVVRELKEASLEKRVDFLRRPRAYLQEALPDLDEKVLESLFYDEDYSERVEGVGIWEPRILPWVKKSGEAWLPDADLGLRIGDTYVRVAPEDVASLREEVARAKEEGRGTVDYRGYAIPATDAALDGLEALVVEIPPELDGPKPHNPDERPDRVVLLVKGNFEEVSYQSGSRPHHGHVGILPAAVDPELPLPHQLDAVRWLQDHWAQGSPGALLADDMGLGKTLAALIFMVWVREQFSPARKRPIVTVAPTGLLSNWIAESEKHLDSGALGTQFVARGAVLRALKTSSSGTELQAGVPLLDIRRLAECDWVLTSYETWRDYQHSFGKIQWSVAVYDEVQKVKNPAAAVTDAAKATKAEFSLALTGTPVETRLADLWCVVDLVQPGQLGSLKEFSKAYEKPPTSVEETITPLRDMLLGEPPAIMKRRLKEDHLTGLPERETHCYRVTMPPGQADAYADAVGRARTSTGKGAVLKALQEMRSVSLHPGFEPGSDDETFIRRSARLMKTFEILDRVAEANQKALVFLEVRDLQGILVEMIQRRYQLSARPLIINGAVSGQKRLERVEEFQGRDGFDVMLLSPRAGGVGLTLTEANHVIHLNRWWNPAVEDQCNDRVYRIGQERKVQIHLPLAVHPEYGDHSFDILLDGLLERRRRLSRTVLAPPAATSEELEQLLTETTSVSTTAAPHDGPVEGSSINVDDLDTMEPLEFERWVLEQLSAAGYQVEKTPRTHDKGCDGIARAGHGHESRTLAVQCKHTQTTSLCGEDAVHEILTAIPYYQLPEETVAVVVTNAGGFSVAAKNLARERNVKLVARDELGELRYL